MHRNVIILVVFILCHLTSFSQSGGFPVSTISDSLKVNANAVVRENIYKYTYYTPQNNIAKIRKVVTVLNKNGDSHAIFKEFYDKFRSIQNIKGNIYDGNGQLIRKIKLSEIVDVAGSDEYAQFDDLRYKYYKPLVSNYPYTIEFEYDLHVLGSYFFPKWMAVEEYNVSVESNILQISVPESYHFNYREFGFNEDYPSVTKGENGEVYTWKVINLKAIDAEPFSSDMYRYVPTVYTMPSSFSLGGFSGTSNTWNDLANWQQKMNDGRDLLTEARINEIKELVRDIPDERERVRKIYKYLQSRTRYFGVQLGIGGLQPMDAKIVDQIGYSDCKGLSNYMKAMLKAIGIESFYTWVHAGEKFPQLIPDFVYDEFNHIILCVPLQKDTVWLECTSQIKPFDFLGSFTSDRQVLIIKPQGGELVRTPEYTLEQNFQYTRAKVTITPDGNGNAEINRKFGGLQYDDKIGYLHCSTDDLQEWLYDYFPIPNYQLTRYEFKNHADQPESHLKSLLNLTGYASSSGKRLFVPLNLTNRSTYIPPKVKSRKFDISLVSSFIDADTVEFSLPEGLTPEFLPRNTEIKTVFGEYHSSVVLKDNIIIYIREVKMFKGHFPKEQYGELIKFFYDMSVADKCQAVLIKKES